MDEQQFRHAVREILFDAARSRAGDAARHEHGWLDQDSAHALERLAEGWSYRPGFRDRETILTEVHAQLSKTDNPLLRAINPERLADSLMKLESDK